MFYSFMTPLTCIARPIRFVIGLALNIYYDDDNDDDDDFAINK